MPAKKFNAYVDLKETNRRIGEFCERYPELADLVSNLRDEAAQHPDIKRRYLNKEDFATFYIGQVLHLNVEYESETGQKFYDAAPSLIETFPDFKSKEELFNKIAAVSDNRPELLTIASFLCKPSDWLEFTKRANALGDTTAQVRENTFLGNSKEILEASAAQGNPLGEFRLSHILRNKKNADYNEERGMELLRKSAAKKHGASLHNLGAYYWNAGDRAKGLELFTEASEQNCPESSEFLRGLYHRGEFVSKDLIEAARLLRKAADQKNPHALIRLTCYFWNGGHQEGDNTAEDSSQAIYYFAKLAEGWDKACTVDLESRRPLTNDYLISVNHKTYNSPLYRSQIIDVINILENHPRLLPRVNGSSSTLIGDLVKVSMSELSAQDVAQIYKRLTTVRSINPALSASCIEVSGCLAKKIAAEIGVAEKDLTLPSTNSYSFTLPRTERKTRSIVDKIRNAPNARLAASEESVERIISELNCAETKIDEVTSSDTAAKFLSVSRRGEDFVVTINPRVNDLPTQQSNLTGTMKSVATVHNPILNAEDIAGDIALEGDRKTNADVISEEGVPSSRAALPPVKTSNKLLQKQAAKQLE